ncbi:MAG: hypothetical protein LC700_04305 [Actinobacteria bacterium]|nr:hypothetical protein [Actinomycetota bacterium]
MQHVGGVAGVGLAEESEGGAGVFGEVGADPDGVGEGERDEASMDGWRGFRFGRLVGWVVLLA